MTSRIPGVFQRLTDLTWRPMYPICTREKACTREGNSPNAYIFSGYAQGIAFLAASRQESGRGNSSLALLHLEIAL
jgi:hypothetical protein